MNEDDDIIVIEPDDTEYEPFDEATPAVPSSRLWIVSAIIGAVLGGGVATAAYWYLRPAPFDQSALQAEIADLRADLVALRERPEPVIPQVNLDPLNRRIEALEARPTVDPLNEEIVSRMEALQEQGFEVPELPDLTSYDQRIESLEADVAELQARPQIVAAPVNQVEEEPYIDPKDLPRFPERVLREGAAELAGSGFTRRLFSRHVRVRGQDSPDRIIDLIATELEAGRPRAALSAFDRLPPQLASLARAWRADMEDALEANSP